uniref:Uncharacterized protein n=1 Tax=Zea mays TaxID=4577 RepID=B6U8J2_MAIZE|nr:hypothetical protein [Zea mays]
MGADRFPSAAEGGLGGEALYCAVILWLSVTSWIIFTWAGDGGEGGRRRRLRHLRHLPRLASRAPALLLVSLCERVCSIYMSSSSSSIRGIDRTGAAPLCYEPSQSTSILHRLRKLRVVVC